jgi:hypothetical protein
MYARNVRPQVEIEEAPPTDDGSDWLNAAVVPLVDPQSKQLGLAARMTF